MTPDPVRCEHPDCDRVVAAADERDEFSGFYCSMDHLEAVRGPPPLERDPDDGGPSAQGGDPA